MSSGALTHHAAIAQDASGLRIALERVLDAHEEQDEREKALAALRQEIPDFDARIEKERAMASVRLEPAKPHGGTGANQYTVKDEKSKEGNSLSANKRKDGGAKSPERIIARLKRDAATDTLAAALLGSIAPPQPGPPPPPGAPRCLLARLAGTHPLLMTPRGSGAD